ncbi:DUF2306 domain-containing protein [Cesiribacter sp. SM1]|uniref:DUF2306 domain-containing protein n=1 Tax=Cesiribacter sp. SM1 TaxID=2861196 RepID=UPI001CD660AA|nr:DUF2306 domain-containing protein [Cesiribacter sp. SM1]
MENLFGNYIGIVHTFFALLAMLSGGWVLLQSKGGKRHRQIGYVYVGAMLLMLLTAFGIYRLYGGFGIFHFFAVISFLTLAGGMYPALKRPHNWLGLHYRLMSWSVAGLYAAFVAEVATRLLPQQYFGLVVGIGSALVLGISAYLIYGSRKHILEKYKKWV